MVIETFLQNTNLLRFVLLFIVGLLILSFYLAKIWMAILPFTFFRIFIAPGIIIHEYSHALGCILTGAKINSISLFEREGGSVKHGQAKIKIIGPVLISMAPIFGGLLSFWVLNELLTNPFRAGLGGTDFFPSLKGFCSNFFNQNWLDWPVWLYLYCVLNLIIVMAPSKQDFKNCFYGLLFVGIVLVLLEYFKLLDGASLVNSFKTPIYSFLWIILGCFIVSSPLLLISKAIKGK